MGRPVPAACRPAGSGRAAAAVLVAAAVLAAACGSSDIVESAAPAGAADSDSPSIDTADAADPPLAASGSESGRDGSGSVEGDRGETADGDHSSGAGDSGAPGREGSGSQSGDAGWDGAVTGREGQAVSGDATEQGADPPAEPEGPSAPLTGLLTSDFSLAERRAVAVKVDNTSRHSRPQVGLGAADVVYEVLIEGGKTRFLAVFHSNIPSLIGPVRSARSTDLDLAADLGAPYLVSSGANSVVLGELRRAHRAGTLVDISGLRVSGPYTRVSDRPAPYNFFFEYPNLGEHTPASVEPLFEYGSNPPGTEDAAGVTIAYHRSSGTVVSHIWDAGLGGWVRIHNGAVHTVDGDFGPSELAPANVAVIFAAYRTSPADPQSPQAESFGSGDALVLTAGSVYRGRWERTTDRAGFQFTDASGSPLRFSPGSTWVLVANTGGRFPVTGATVMTQAESAALLAEARAAAEPAGN